MLKSLGCGAVGVATKCFTRTTKRRCSRAFERLERTWLRRYRGEPPSTADFIALASRVAHRALTDFLRAWLYDTTTPPMPGHPDRTVAPVAAATTAMRSSTADARAERRRR